MSYVAALNTDCNGGIILRERSLPRLISGIAEHIAREARSSRCNSGLLALSVERLSQASAGVGVWNADRSVFYVGDWAAEVPSRLAA